MKRKYDQLKTEKNYELSRYIRIKIINNLEWNLLDKFELVAQLNWNEIIKYIKLPNTIEFPRLFKTAILQNNLSFISATCDRIPFDKDGSSYNSPYTMEKMLDYACLAKKWNIVQFFVKKGTNYDIILEYASKDPSSNKLVKYLINKDKIKNPELYINLIIRNLDTEIVIRLIQTYKCVPYAAGAIYSVLVANKHYKNKIKIMKEILKIKNGKIEVSMLSIAVYWNNHIEVIKWMLKNTLNIYRKDDNGRNILHDIASYGNIEIFKYFVNNTDIPYNILDNHRCTPVLCLLNQHKINNVKDLYDIFTDEQVINFRDDNNNTILHYICMACHNIELINCMLDIFDINIENNSGTTPILCVALEGNIELFKYLESRGANINHVSRYGTNVLSLAVSSNHIELVEYILEKKIINVNSRDSTGNTCLHYAKRNLDIFKLLVERGASINSYNKDKKTPYDVANKYIKEWLDQ